MGAVKVLEAKAVEDISIPVYPFRDVAGYREVLQGREVFRCNGEFGGFFFLESDVQAADVSAIGARPRRPAEEV